MPWRALGSWWVAGVRRRKGSRFVLYSPSLKRLWGSLSLSYLQWWRRGRTASAKRGKPAPTSFVVSLRWVDERRQLWPERGV
jgi:hypothetical protein